jgi:amino acid permease
MQYNIGRTDRTVRVIAGIVLLAFALDGHGWGWLGIIPLVTGVFGICPLYSLIHVSTSHPKPT